MKKYFYGIDKQNKVHRFDTIFVLFLGISSGNITRHLSATSREVRSAKHLAKGGKSWPIQLS